MEEEAVQPGGSEETMLERLFSYYGSVQGDNKGYYLAYHCLLKRSTVFEFAGTVNITVNAPDIIGKIKIFPVCYRNQSPAARREAPSLLAWSQSWDKLGGVQCSGLVESC